MYTIQVQTRFSGRVLFYFYFRFLTKRHKRILPAWTDRRVSTWRNTPSRRKLLERTTASIVLNLLCDFNNVYIARRRCLVRCQKQVTARGNGGGCVLTNKKWRSCHHHPYPGRAGQCYKMKVQKSASTVYKRNHEDYRRY